MAFVERDAYPMHAANGATCFVCASAQRVIDDRPERVFEVEYREALDGTPYVCETCLTEVVRMLGMVTPEEWAESQKRIAALLVECAEMRTRAEAAEAVADAVTGYKDSRKPPKSKVADAA